MPAGYVLETMQGPQPGRKFSIERGVARIGREVAGAEVVLDDPSVSRRHAIIVMEGGGYSLQDLGSTNGTMHRGKELLPGTKTLLGNGDEIRVGEVVLRFELNVGEGGPAATNDNPTRRLAPRCGRQEPGPTGETEIAGVKRMFSRKVVVAAVAVLALLVLITVLVLVKRA